MLKNSPGVEVKVFDPFGWLMIIAFNHLYPPFDNPRLLRALLPAVDQSEFIQAVVGDQSDLGRTPASLNALLRMPLAAEARYIATGRRLPAGLSLLAVFA